MHSILPLYQGEELIHSYNMIKAENIQKSFGSLQVLKGIDLEVKEGEIVSIVGPSGAGKTTLLLIMGTLEKSDAGTITIAGQELQKLKEKKLSDFRNKHLGFVFQFHQLLPEFTLENAMIPALIGNVSTIKQKRHELLDLMGPGTNRPQAQRALRWKSSAWQ